MQCFDSNYSTSTSYYKNGIWELFQTNLLIIPVNNPDYLKKNYHTKTKSVGCTWFIDKMKENLYKLKE